MIRESALAVGEKRRGTKDWKRRQVSLEGKEIGWRETQGWLQAEHLEVKGYFKMLQKR